MHNALVENNGTGRHLTIDEGAKVELAFDEVYMTNMEINLTKP